MKYVNLFLISFLLLFPVSVFSQSTICEQFQIQEQDMEKLNNKIFSKLKKCMDCSNLDELEFIHVYWLGLIKSYQETIMTKDDLISREFMEKVKPHFLPHKKNILKKEQQLSPSMSIIVRKSDGEVIGGGSSNFFQCYVSEGKESPPQTDTEFVEITRKKDFVMFFSLFWSEPVFALTSNDELWVIKRNKETWELITLDYFLENYYECWWDPWECARKAQREAE